LGDLGADGSTLLWREDSQFGLIGRARGDTKDRDLSWLDWSTVPRISQDGKTLVFTEEGDGGGPDYSVYLRGMDGSPAVRLGSGLAVALSPDGKWVLSVRLNPEPSQYVLLPTGAGEPKVLTNDSLAHGLGGFTPDGTHVTFGGFAPGGRPRVYLQALAGGEAKPLTPEGVTGVPSPDGKLVAATDGKLYPTDGGAPRPIPGFTPGDIIERWASESGTLFVRQPLPSGDQRIYRIDAAGRRALALEVARPAGATIGRWFTITADGSAYVTTCSVSRSDLFRVSGLN
jgi:dipeptidyl aminopeptidase/acylaminoacyl peptidase